MKMLTDDDSGTCIKHGVVSDSSPRDIMSVVELLFNSVVHVLFALSPT